MTTPPAQSDTRATLWIYLGLAAITVGVFWPVVDYTFIQFDDNEYVFENGFVLMGLTWHGVREAFSTTISAHWHPLTMLSLMLDATLYGTNAGGYHATNVILHTANVLLLFFVLRSMTGAMWPSAIVAAIFAIHPLHVEPVVWIASRKDLLSATFFFFAIAAYLRYVRTPSMPRFLLVVACMLAGLMSKSIVLVLPCALLLLDYWPLRRLSRDNLRTVLTEKAALLPLSILFVVINATAQSAAGQVGAITQFSLLDRIGNAAVAYGTYLYQTIWPRDLALYYPLPGDGYAASTIAVAVAVLAAMTIAALLCARRHPAVLFGWFWFLGVLAPVVGLVQLGAQAHADRYMYLPLAGLAIAVVWPAYTLASNRRVAVATTAVTSIAVVAFASVAAITVTHWRDSEVAFKRALAVTEDNYLIHYNYGVALEGNGRFAEAILQYQAAIAIHPQHAASHINVGALRAHFGQHDRAIAHFEAAVASQPDNATALCNLAMALTEAGRPEDAMTPMRHALEVAPGAARTRETARVVLAAQPKRQTINQGDENE